MLSTETKIVGINICILCHYNLDIYHFHYRYYTDPPIYQYQTTYRNTAPYRYTFGIHRFLHNELYPLHLFFCTFLSRNL